MAEKIYWMDNDGGTIDLTDGVKYDILDGIDGRWMPPFEMVSDEVYAVPGDYVRLRKTKTREITLPIIVYGTSASDFLTNIRMLTDAFDPSKGDGVIRVDTNDSPSKTFLLTCHFSSGMSFPETYDTGNCTFRKFVATLQSHDVFWWNAVENETLWAGDLASHFYHTVTNSGDVDTYPIWDINGSATTVTAVLVANYTTGKWFNFTNMGGHLIIVYDHMIVDTRPGKRSATINHTTNVFDHMDSYSTLFPLVPGVNKIFIETTGGTLDTYAKCRWRDMYYGV